MNKGAATHSITLPETRGGEDVEVEDGFRPRLPYPNIQGPSHRQICLLVFTINTCISLFTVVIGLRAPQACKIIEYQ